MIPAGSNFGRFVIHSGLWKTTMAWKTGVWLRSRDGLVSRTTVSKGRSALAKASSTVLRVRASSSPKLGSPERSRRSARGLMK